ncbi:MAG: hypothetical protein AAF558_00570 [Verrucomicrobiota bacterium]
MMLFRKRIFWLGFTVGFLAYGFYPWGQIMKGDVQVGTFQPIHAWLDPLHAYPIIIIQVAISFILGFSFWGVLKIFKPGKVVEPIA